MRDDSLMHRMDSLLSERGYSECGQVGSPGYVRNAGGDSWFWFQFDSEGARRNISILHALGSDSFQSIASEVSVECDFTRSDVRLSELSDAIVSEAIRKASGGVPWHGEGMGSILTEASFVFSDR